ncbi:TIGR00341 family protein [Methanobacterium sp. ACI-7]|uniref:TIGR00341 family protein n=1 Tax=unclassified Methanobacterium TaxID=2627676 RepID=UPI0039C1510C
MVYRLIIIVIPNYENLEEIKGIIGKYDVLNSWYIESTENQIIYNVIIRRAKTESFVNTLQKRFSKLEGFRINLLPVEASVPVPESLEKTLLRTKESEERGDTTLEELTDRLDPGELINRLSRHEIYANISDMAKLSNIFILMVILSSIVAAIGVVNNNVAVIIGAMVIAPFLGPNMALSLATTLGDRQLAKDSIKSNYLGLLIAFLLSVFLGLIFTVDPTVPEVALRAKTNLGSITLAFASGIAGALAFTAGFSTTLIGVMVAVALLPPLVTCGLLFGSGEYSLALGAFLLFFINLVCVNLAGILAFKFQKIRPIYPERIENAKKMTNIALILWTSLLSIFIVLILLYRGAFDLLLLQ